MNIACVEFSLAVTSIAPVPPGYLLHSDPPRFVGLVAGAVGLGVLLGRVLPTSQHPIFDATSDHLLTRGLNDVVALREGSAWRRDAVPTPAPAAAQLAHRS